MTNLERAILATVCYYDALDYPLTSWEVWRYLVNPHRLGGSRKGLQDFEEGSLHGVLQALEGETLRPHVMHCDGLYCLGGREHLSGRRVGNQTRAIRRWRKARRLAGLLRAVPFVRMVAGSGSLALSNQRSESDLDFFIVAAEGRIWTVRLAVTALLHLLGVRRHGNRIAGRVCLNHFVTEAAMTVPHQTMYTAQLYARLVPLVGRTRDGGPNGVLQRFWSANRWMEEFLAFPPVQSLHRHAIPHSRFLGAVARAGEWLLSGFFGAFVERFARWMQMRWMRRHRTIPDGAETSGRIVVSETELAFHPDSPEVGVLRRFHDHLRARDLALDESGGVPIMAPN